MARPVPTGVIIGGWGDGIHGYGLTVNGEHYLNYYLVGIVDAYQRRAGTAVLHADNGLFLRLLHGENK